MRGHRGYSPDCHVDLHGLYHCSPLCISGLSCIIAAWMPILTKDKSRCWKYFTKKQMLKKWAFQQWLSIYGQDIVMAFSPPEYCRFLCRKEGLPRRGHTPVLLKNIAHLTNPGFCAQGFCLFVVACFILFCFVCFFVKTFGRIPSTQEDSLCVPSVGFCMN